MARHLFDSLGHGTGAPEPGDDMHIMVSYTPMFWAALEALVCEWLCALTRHRTCNTKLWWWAYDAADKRTKTFYIPADRDTLKAYYAFMGWEWWGDEDDDE